VQALARDRAAASFQPQRTSTRPSFRDLVQFLSER
jgi:hypothetical protein